MAEPGAALLRFILEPRDTHWAVLDQHGREYGRSDTYQAARVLRQTLEQVQLHKIQAELGRNTL